MTQWTKHNGTYYSEVKRRAIVGEIVRVVYSYDASHVLNVGNIVTITRQGHDGVATERMGSWMGEDDYVVLEPLRRGDQLRLKTYESCGGSQLDVTKPHLFKSLSVCFADGVCVDTEPDRNRWVVAIGDVERWPAPSDAKKGDWVRSTTGRSWAGYDVPTNVDYEVRSIDSDGDAHIIAKSPISNLKAGTFVITRLASSTLVTPKATPTSVAPAQRHEKRFAKGGERILVERVVSQAHYGTPQFSVGETFTVKNVGSVGNVIYVEERHLDVSIILPDEYVVLVDEVPSAKRQATSDKRPAPNAPTPPVAFSVGDKVRIVVAPGRYNHRHEKGAIGEVTCVGIDGDLSVRVDKTTQCVHPSEVALVTPKTQQASAVEETPKTSPAIKVGDYVKITSSGFHNFDVGSVGIVESISTRTDSYFVAQTALSQFVQPNQLVLSSAAERLEYERKALNTSKARVDAEIDAARAKFTAEVADLRKGLDAATAPVVALEKSLLTPGTIVRALSSGRVGVLGGIVYGHCAYLGGNTRCSYSLSDLELVYEATHPIAKSYAARTTSTFREGDIVDLTSGHCEYSRGKRRTLGTPWENGSGFEFAPTIGYIVLGTRAERVPDATLVTPVELRTDISDAEKLRLAKVGR